ADLVEAVDREEIESVEQLDIGDIVPPVAVVLRAAAAAIVEAINVAWLLCVSRQKSRQRMEVSAVASEPGKADHAAGFRGRRLVVAHMQPKVVERRVGEVLPQLASRLGHVEDQTLGACLEPLAARGARSHCHEVWEGASLTSSQSAGQQPTLIWPEPE